MASQKIRGITIELSADCAGILDGLKEINSSLSKTQRGLNDVNKLLKLDPDNVTLLTQKQQYLTEAIEQTQKKLEYEKEALESLKNSEGSEKTLEQQRALEREIESTSQKLEKYQTDLSDTTSKLDSMGEEAEDAGKGFEKTSDAVQALAQSEAFKRIAEDADKLAEAMMECVEKAEAFEFSMAKVETLAHAGDGLTDMAEAIKTSALAYGVSASDFAEGVYQAMSAGVAADKAVEFTQNMTKLAVGGFTDSATAVDIVTTALNSYGLSMEATTHIMDDLIMTQNLGKTTVDDLAQNMGRVIPTASAYSVSIDNLAAAYSELTAKGIKTRITTTDLNALFGELGDSTKGVAQIIKEMSGQTFGQFMESGNSLADALALLWEYAEEDKEAFYGLFSQSTAATAAFNIASDGGERFNEILKQMGDNSGLAQSNFETIANTAEMTGRRFEVAVENLQIALGDSLAPTLDAIKEKGIEVIEPLTQFIQENPQLVAALTGLVAGVVGVTAAVTACAAAVALLKAAFGDVTGLVGVLGGLLAGGAVVGTITGMSMAMDNATVSAREFRKALQEEETELQSSNTDLEEHASKVFKLAQRISQLNSVTELDAKNTLELKDAVSEWNDLTSDSNQLILDETGHVEDLSQHTLNYYATLEGIKDLEEEYNNITSEKNELLDELEKAQQRQLEVQEELSSRTNLTLEEQKMLNHQYEESQEIIDECNQKIGEYTDTQVDLNSRIEEATNLTREYEAEQQAETEQIEAVKQANEELIESYEKAYESSLKSLQGQREEFEKYTTSAGQSVDDLIHKFETQAENMRGYAELIAEAYRIMQTDPSSADLLSYYIQQGPAAAGELNNLVTAFNDGADGMKAFNEAVDAFNNTTDILDTIAELQAGIETGYAEPIENALLSLDENLPLITETLSASYEEQLANAEQHKTDMTDAVSSTCTDMADAMTANKSTLEDAAKSAMDSCVNAAQSAIGYSNGQSSVFYNLGMNIDSSIASGISANAGLIASAIQGALDSAASSISFAAITARVNQAMGEAFR